MYPVELEREGRGSRVVAFSRETVEMFIPVLKSGRFCGNFKNLNLKRKLLSPFTLLILFYFLPRLSVDDESLQSD